MSFFLVFLLISFVLGPMVIIIGLRNSKVRAATLNEVSHAPSGKSSVLLVPGILFALIATPVLFLSVANLYHDCQFSGSVVRVLGSVDRLNIIPGKTTEYCVNYHYLSGDHLEHATNVEVRRITYLKFHVGESIPIKYLPNDPGASRIDDPDEDQSQWRNALLGCAVGVVFIGIGLYSAFKSKRRNTIPLDQALSNIQSAWKNR